MAVEPSRWGIIYNPKAGSRKTQRDGMRYETIWKAVKSYLIMFSRRGSALWSGWRGRWPITVIEPL